MARRVDDEHLQYEGDFWPRDHGKSEIFCVAYPLRRVCEDPDVRILIVQKTATEAEKTLQVIKTELEKNAALKRYYADHWQQVAGQRDISNATGAVDREGRKESAWQQRRIYCKRSRVGKDPTVEAVGVGGAITGGHFDVIILDDVEDDENTKTADRLESLREWFTGTIMQLREPHTKTIVVGTLKTAAQDIYNFILGNPVWACRVVSAITSHELGQIDYLPVYGADGRLVDVDVRTPDVKTLWPARWPIKALLMEMLASIRSIWVREKLNDLRAMSGKIFKREWFQYVERDKLPEQFEIIVQAWDTAFEEKQSADWSAGVTVGMAQGKIYVLDVFRAKVEFPELVGAIKAQHGKWRPQFVVVEKRASGRSALQVLRRETTLPVIEIEPGGKDKPARARSITPYFESGRVVFVAGATWLAAFEDELTLFPEAAHDDQVDALVYAILRLLTSGGIGVSWL
jgi:predicted phage terminase large subunit-like protein